MLAEDERDCRTDSSWNLSFRVDVITSKPVLDAVSNEGVFGSLALFEEQDVGAGDLVLFAQRIGWRRASALFRAVCWDRAAALFQMGGWAGASCPAWVAGWGSAAALFRTGGVVASSCPAGRRAAAPCPAFDLLPACDLLPARDLRRLAASPLAL